MPSGLFSSVDNFSQGAIKNVARIHDLSIDESIRLSRMVPDRLSEKVGMLKMDFLGLNTLVFKSTCTHNIKIK